jgi:hypothetical protein
VSPPVETEPAGGIVTVGPVRFEESARLSTPSLATSVVDVNGDGRVDLVPASREELLVSMANGAGFAEPVAVAMPVGESVNGWGLHDLDGDGDLDLIPATRALDREEVRDFDADGRPDLLLSAHADAGFPDERCPRFQQEFVCLQSYRGWFLLRNVSTPADINASPPEEKGVRRLADGVAADLDLDDDVDVAFVNRDDGGGADSVKSIAVFRNDGTWPIGAVVTVFDTEGDPIAVDEVRTDYSYRAKRTPLLHFGLGAVDTVDVRITLPFDGGTTWHRDVPVDQLARLSR